MSEGDREKWDQKFADRPDEPGEPEPFLVDQVSRLQAGSVLDVACGDGRNALFLTEWRFDVTGLDVSEKGLERLERFARKRSLRVETHRADLDADDALHGLGPFDNIVVIRFKPEPALWPRLVTALRPGGILLVSTFNREQHRQTGFAARFCLEPGELEQIHPELDLIYYASRPGPPATDGYLFRRWAGDDDEPSGP